MSLAFPAEAVKSGDVMTWFFQSSSALLPPSFAAAAPQRNHGINHRYNVGPPSYKLVYKPE